MLKGRVAVVTGASRGIGAAVSLKLASLGADIAAIYAGNRENAEEICARCRDQYGVRATAYCCDVADFEQTRETVNAIRREFSGVHILINNAGMTRDRLVASMREEDFDRVLDVNLKGAFNMIRHCSRAFIAGRWGGNRQCQLGFRHDRQRRTGQLCCIQGGIDWFGQVRSQRTGFPGRAM